MKKFAAGEFCPLVKGACVRDTCAFWTSVRGIHPQTGVEIDQPACAIAWLPVLLIDQTQQIRQQAAVSEKARNALATVELADRMWADVKQPESLGQG